MNDTPIMFHDPTIIEGEDGFYCFSTDTNIKGVQISKSTDMINWQILKPAFASPPESVLRHTGHGIFWAPEIIKHGEGYRLYCCSSMFGKTQSVIGLAESPSLEEDFVYKGDVVRTYHNSPLSVPNAIDANIVTDRDGTQYMVYGSFFGGIFIAELNEEGFLAQPGYGKLIAGGNHTAIEGAFVVYDEQRDRFCLFVSYGSLTYDYNIRVAYSKSIDGPYLDSNGYEMTDTDPIRSVGDKIAGGYNFDVEGEKGYMAPGHNSVLKRNGELYVVHHIREEGDEKFSTMHIRKIFFDTQGRIFLSPTVSSEKPLEMCDNTDAQYSVIRFDRFNNGVAYGRKLHVTSKSQDGELCVNLYGNEYKGVAYRHKNRHYFTAVSETGECVWGMSL